MDPLEVVNRLIERFAESRRGVGQHFSLLYGVCNHSTLWRLVQEGAIERVVPLVAACNTRFAIISRLRRPELDLQCTDDLWFARVYSELRHLKFVHHFRESSDPAQAISLLLEDLVDAKLHRWSTIQEVSSELVSDGLMKVTARYGAAEGDEEISVEGRPHFEPEPDSLLRRLGERRSKLVKQLKPPSPSELLVRKALAASALRLQRLARRVHVLEPFEIELRRVTRGKPFFVYEDIVWMMVRDSRDMLLLDLASWAKGTYQSGGLIGTLASNCGPLTKTRRRSRDEHPSSRAIPDGDHAAAFKRLFPNAMKERPSAGDFTALRDNFATRMQAVVDDRDSNLAHRFEVHRSGTVKMVDLTDLRAAITFAESFINDLTHVSAGVTSAFNPMLISEPTKMAKQMVDAVLIGGAGQIAMLRGKLDRDAFYGDLHARHAPHAQNTLVTFNGELIRGAILEDRMRDSPGDFEH